MEGPRLVRLEETASLDHLADVVFMEGKEGLMRRFYPTMFCESNFENHVVFVDAGRVVSHVGMTQRWACVNGCTVRVACIGAVGTLEEYRGKGLGTQLVQAAYDKARADGVDFFLISGDRRLYRRAGAADAGCDYTTILERRTARRVHRRAFVLSDVSESDLASYKAAYAARRAHFVRPPEDWRCLVQDPTCRGRDIRGITIRKNGIFRGYFVVTKPDDKCVGAVLEFAGDELDLAGALRSVMDECECRSLALRLQTGDGIFRQVLEAAGADFRAVPGGYTLLVVNFPQLMQRLAPAFEARVGTGAAGRLSFQDNGDTLLLAMNGNEVSLSKGEAAQVIFGHPEPKPRPGMLAQLLPVANLDYGINYV